MSYAHLGTGDGQLGEQTHDECIFKRRSRSFTPFLRHG